MNVSMESRLAKIEKRIQKLEEHQNQDEWLIAFVSGLEAHVMKKEATPEQEKAFNDYLERKSKLHSH